MNDTNSRDTAFVMLAALPLPLIFAARGGVLFIVGALLTLLPEWALIMLISRVGKGKAGAFHLSVTAAAVTVLLSVISVFWFSGRAAAYIGKDIDRMLVVTLCLLSSLYIAFLSPSAMVRVCKAVTFLIVVLFLLTAALSVKNGDITNLHISSQDPGQEVKKGFLSAMPLCVPLVALLSVRLTKGEKLSGVSLYTPLKGAMLVLFTIPVIYVCGESAFYDKLPSYRLSAYSQSVLIERMNAPFILMCIMAAILFSAVFFGAAVTAVRGIYEKA